MKDLLYAEQANCSSNAQHADNALHQQLSFSGQESHDSGNEPIAILQINAEGWTRPKSEILQNICEKRKISVVLVEETHQQEPSAVKLYRYTLAHFSSSPVQGIATFVRNSIRFS